MPVGKPLLCRILLLIALVSCKPLPGYCQTNFLLNGNFEDINTCSEYKAECGVEAWFYLRDVKVQMISNEANKGAGRSSFGIFYNWTGYRGFTPAIGTILPCNLQEGKEYIFKGWISARLNGNLILKPGICTGENFYVPKRPFSSDMKPDSIVQVKQVEETPFYKFEYHFLATGDERYLTFGTFVSKDEMSDKRNSAGSETVSLLLDNFSLISPDPKETLCAAYKYNREAIYKYDYRHKDMDYTLYGKGKLPVELSKDKEENLTRFEFPSPTPVKPDTLKLGDVLFDFNKADLKTNAVEMLEKYFKNNTGERTIDSIYIEGHTDSVGSDARNIQLSQERSESVMKWIIDNNIVTTERIAIHAFGRVRPVASNKTAAGRALNRRVEVIIFRRR